MADFRFTDGFDQYMDLLYGRVYFMTGLGPCMVLFYGRVYFMAGLSPNMDLLYGRSDFMTKTLRHLRTLNFTADRENPDFEKLQTL